MAEVDNSLLFAFERLVEAEGVLPEAALEPLAAALLSPALRASVPDIIVGKYALRLLGADAASGRLDVDTLDTLRQLEPLGNSPGLEAAAPPQQLVLQLKTELVLQALRAVGTHQPSDPMGLANQLFANPTPEEYARYDQLRQAVSDPATRHFMLSFCTPESTTQALAGFVARAKAALPHSLLLSVVQDMGQGYIPGHFVAAMEAAHEAAGPAAPAAGMPLLLMSSPARNWQAPLASPSQAANRAAAAAPAGGRAPRVLAAHPAFGGEEDAAPMPGMEGEEPPYASAAVSPEQPARKRARGGREAPSQAPATSQHQLVGQEAAALEELQAAAATLRAVGGADPLQATLTAALAAVPGRQTVAWRRESLGGEDLGTAPQRPQGFDDNLVVTRPAGLSPPKRRQQNEGTPDKGRRKVQRWTAEETQAFMDTAQRVGTSWAAIKEAAGDALAERSQVDLKDKWRNLSRAKKIPEAVLEGAAKAAEAAAAEALARRAVRRKSKGGDDGDASAEGGAEEGHAEGAEQQGEEEDAVEDADTELDGEAGAAEAQDEEAGGGEGEEEEGAEEGGADEEEVED